MSANNQVIIRKINNSCFQGFDVDVDAYEGVIEDASWNDGKPIFEAQTLEDAIHKYYEYCEELATQGMYVEYGLAFEGV